ncbi:MAG TPA: 4-alpha-glucanotransferase, partial [Cellvibrio sp.]
MLAELIAYCGIETEYHDAWGQQTQVPQAQQLALLAAQGFDIENEEHAREQLLERRAHFWQQLLAPVSVQLQQQPVIVELQLPLALANEPLSLQLICEDGRQQTTELVAVDGELQQVILLDDTEYHQYQLVTDWQLSPGYHHLSVLCPVNGRKYEQRLIITPGQCFQPPQFRQKKQWGSAVQLYSLRSERNWGIGDFTDLKNLTGYLAQHGADFIGLNPVHALYPAMPESASPYSPSSRRWLNIIYIDVETMPGFNRCSEVQNLLVSAEMQQRLAALRQTGWVDYQGVMQQKLPVMKQLYHYVMQHPQHFTEELQQFEAFKAAGGQSLQQLALYDALHAWLLERDSQNWGWPVWPEDYRKPDSEAVTLFAREHQEQLDCYCYLQFIANRQLEEVQQYAKKQGMLLGLYRDLAVGVSEASTEIWGNPELYCRQASVGAPPDPLGPTG